MNLLVALALAPVAAPVPKADPLQEAKQNFQGEWKMVKYVSGRAADDPQEVTDGKMVVTGDKLTVHFRGEERGTFTLDPKADPPTIDITMAMKNLGKDVVVKGIYKLEKDKLTVCFGLNATARPKEFKVEKGTDTAMFVLERVKR
jgi:uncharacterized protein (TIGR03067 family)